jgi:tRNA (mo5U34)-methyltransferase
MLDLDCVYERLASLGLEEWRTALDERLRARLGERGHGDMARWRRALANLPRVDRMPGNLDADAVGTAQLELMPGDRDRTRAALAALAPWRKGPFRIGDILIDTEWRSNLKWDRLRDAVSPLTGRLVLDVGCGNGYYALRMRGAGARAVVGIDPTLLFIAQFQAIAHFLDDVPVVVLPLRMDELPTGSSRFDTVFSMGVLYHTRAPIDHLRALREALRDGGELVLETLVLPGDDALSRTPAARYARMRNVWHLPTIPELLIWLERAGLRDAEVIDVSMTTVDEQRTTEWMPYESLAEALDPDDPTRTVEGWPAPIRAAVIARKPG